MSARQKCSATDWPLPLLESAAALTQHQVQQLWIGDNSAAMPFQPQVPDAVWVAKDNGATARLLTDGVVSFVEGDRLSNVEPEHLPWDTPGSIDSVTVPCGAGDAGFGLQFSGARDVDHALKSRAGIYISGVDPGTPAAAMAEQLVGKQVVSASGIDMKKGTLNGMVQVLQSLYDQAEGSPDGIVLLLTPAQADPAWAWGTVERTGERGLIPLDSIGELRR